MSEFDIIQRHFNWPQQDQSIKVGNGDDAAVVSLRTGEELAISVDTSIKGVHFPHDTPAHAVGHKSLAVNLSDMAAMGATPRWFTLALTLPTQNEEWLQAFSNSLKTLADQHNVSLIGGDTTRGPLSITIQIMGTLPKGSALRRSGAQPGDLICVTGTPGDAAAGLACLQNRLQLPTTEQAYCVQRLNYPTPRLAFGERLRMHAHSCIDVSDGLCADLQHILDQSGVNATLATEQIPTSAALSKLPAKTRNALTLSGGDDYELLFTIPADQLDAIQHIAAETNTGVTAIGQVGAATTAKPTLTLTTGDMTVSQGFNHFAQHNTTTKP